MRVRHLLPGEYRLFEIGDTGVAAGQHLAELVDQGRGRRVDVLADMTEADHAPRAFGNGDEVERIRPFDIIKRDAMY